MGPNGGTVSQEPPQRHSWLSFQKDQLFWCASKPDFYDQLGPFAVWAAVIQQKHAHGSLVVAGPPAAKPSHYLISAKTVTSPETATSTEAASARACLIYRVLIHIASASIEWALTRLN